MMQWEPQDDESQKEALRRFHQREHLHPYVVSPSALRIGMLICLIILGAVAAWWAISGLRQ